MNRIVSLLLWFLIGATVLVASVPTDSYASALTYTVPKIALTLGWPAAQIGGQQQLTIQIDEVQGRRTSLILVVTYPSGEIERSLHYVDSGMGTIAWKIPANAGLGEATFRLVANGCTCGEHNTIPQQSAVDGTVEGSFAIGPLQ